MSTHNRIYVTPSHTKKIFRNIRRVGKGFSRRETSLFPAMVVQAQEEMGEAEQDSGNINKTQSKATPNEPSSLGTSSGGGPKRQNTKGDTSARTRSARMVSFDEASLGDQEDASKQGRNMDDIDANENIYLVNVNIDKDMFRVNDLEGNEVVVETKVASKDVNLSVDEVTLAQTLAALKSAKPKADKVMIQESEQGTITKTTVASTRPKV
ncbi:hypothetical protein Tco_0455620 [Tanacetum coccineum]